MRRRERHYQRGHLDHNKLSLTRRRFTELCKAVNCSEPMFAGNFAAAIQQFDTNSDGVIDFKEFAALNKKFPMLLFPAFRMQEAMQRLTLGTKSWTKILEDYNSHKFAPKGAKPVYRFFQCCAKKNELKQNRYSKVNVKYIDSTRPRLIAFNGEMANKAREQKAQDDSDAAASDLDGAGDIEDEVSGSGRTSRSSRASRASRGSSDAGPDREEAALGRLGQRPSFG